MKAGDALGLLAGLGALNALGGGRNGTGKRFTGLMDMLDGGGAGASGDRFEGGGLLSILGNLFAKPLEAQDRVERIAADTNATNAVTEVLKKAITPAQRSSAAMTEMGRQRGLLADQFDPRDMQGATGFRAPVQSGPPMPATAFSPVMPNQPMSSYDEVPVIRGTAGTPTAPYEQTGAITDIRFGPRGEPTSLLDTRQQAPSPDEARALRAIAENNMMDQYINLPPYQQKAMIETMLQRGY